MNKNSAQDLKKIIKDSGFFQDLAKQVAQNIKEKMDLTDNCEKCNDKLTEDESCQAIYDFRKKNITVICLKCKNNLEGITL
jgi:recombinational DNA repair protein RecR